MQLIALLQNEEYICKIAETVEEAKDIVETGFEYVTEVNGVKLFRKMKTSYLGTRSIPEGPWSSMDYHPSGDISRKFLSFCSKHQKFKWPTLAGRGAS